MQLSKCCQAPISRRQHVVHAAHRAGICAGIFSRRAPAGAAARRGVPGGIDQQVRAAVAMHQASESSPARPFSCSATAGELPSTTRERRRAAERARAAGRDQAVQQRAARPRPRSRPSSRRRTELEPRRAAARGERAAASAPRAPRSGRRCRRAGRVRGGRALRRDRAARRQRGCERARLLRRAVSAATTAVRPARSRPPAAAPAAAGASSGRAARCAECASGRDAPPGACRRTAPAAPRRTRREIRVAAQVPAHVHIRPERGEVLRLERLEHAGVDVQLLGRLQHGQALAFARRAQPRADAADVGRELALVMHFSRGCGRARPARASGRCSGKSSCSLRA